MLRNHADDCWSQGIDTGKYSQTDVELTRLSLIVYHNNLETLIVWSEDEGVDLALSFQEAEGCGEIW